MEYIRVEQKGAVAVVTIDRPKVLNTLTPNVLKELHQIMDSLDNDQIVRAVILTGAGEKAFSAGADIAFMSTMPPEEAPAFAETGQRTTDRIAAMRRPTIAAINGFALGGGCALAMACDMRIASAKAKMGIPEVTRGIIPCFGGTQRLPRLVGTGMAMELLSTGRQCGAQECKEIGLVNQVVRAEELMDTCMELAEKIARNSAAAIALGKHCVFSGIGTDLTRALELERGAFASAFTTPDRREGLAAFLEKRPANFV